MLFRYARRSTQLGLRRHLGRAAAADHDFATTSTSLDPAAAVAGPAQSVHFLTYPLNTTTIARPFSTTDGEVYGQDADPSTTDKDADTVHARSPPPAAFRGNRPAYTGPQSTEPRIDLLSDPTLARLDPIQAAKRIISIPIGKLNPADVTHGLLSLLKSCSRIQTEAGMETTKSLLERFIEEKRNINGTLLRDLEHRALTMVSGEYGDDSSSNSCQEPLIISQLPFHIIAHGWALMSGRGYYRQGPDNVSDIIDWMAREDEYDQKIWAEVQELLPVEKQDETFDKYRSSCQPTTATFNTLLTAYVYATKQDRRAGQKAEGVLQKMARLHEEKGWHTKPNTRSFGLAISTHAKSDRYKSATFANHVLNDMKAMHEAERERYESEVGRPYNVNSPNENAWQIVTPDVIAYTDVISAYASADAKGYAQRAEDTLFEMMDNKDKYGIKPDAQAFATAIRAWAQAAKRMGNPKARFEAAERAEGMLRLMEELAAEQDDEEEVGDTNEGVGETSHAPEDMDEWEDEQINTDGQKNDHQNPLAPTTQTYNAVLAAWARSDIQEAAPRAEALLQKMLASVIPPTGEGEGNADVLAAGAIPAPPPDRLSFNITIGAHARSFDAGAAEKGEELFDMMYELYHSGRMGEEIKPKADTYSSVINAWARSRGKPGQTANARRLLDTMLGKFRGGEEDMAPNVLSYTAVLNAAVNEAIKEKKDEWAGGDEVDEEGVEKPFDDDSPYSIAMRTYHEMKVDAHDVGVQPDHITYSTMIKVISSHTGASSTERRSMLETIFDDACASGRVSSAVIKELRIACPTVDLLERLLRSRKWATSKKSIYNELPHRWKKNVREDQRHHKVNMADMKKKEAAASS